MPESVSATIVSQFQIHSISEKISKIDSSQLEFIKLIGNGSFGQVWKGKWRQTQVAIKQIKPEIFDEKSKNKKKLLLL